MRMLGLAAVPLLLVAGCFGSSGSTGSVYKTATSAAASGGMTALVAAAKAEGKLNLIAVPPGWANYAAITSGFTAMYGIEIATSNPNGSSQDEIRALKESGTSTGAPDVVDLQMADAVASSTLLAPYRVATWNDIPDSQKDPTGLWFEDYGGYMSIGYDSRKVLTIDSISDLLGPTFKGKVALKGDPVQDSDALSGVLMASLASGGQPGDVSRGVDFFHQLKLAGSFTSVHATTATIISGTTPLVFDWDYLSAAHRQDIPTWKLFIPTYGALGSYFAQAINKNAPHPAAARLWEEYLFSDQGQNLLLNGHVRPVRMLAMQNAGTVDQAAAAALPPVSRKPVFLTSEQVIAARNYLAAHWAQAIG